MNCRTALLSAAFFAVVSTPGVAQTSLIHEGSWLVAGSASLTRSHSDDGSSTSTHAALVPTGLRFMNDHLAIGGSAVLAYDDFGGGGGHAVTYGIGPAARLYASTVTDWKPFIAASVAPE